MAGSESSDPLLGRVIDDRYRIDGVLGRGGMGAVYRARQLGIERDVAFKVLRSDRRRPAETRRFEAEARIIARLRHPHTVRLIDFGTMDDDLYLVLELVGGSSLKARIVEQSLTPALALELCAQVADALTEAHGLGIVHRDLKPANIVVERVGDREVARILDFGVAHADGGGLTRTGAMIGTPAYMAPEQVRAQPVSPATDLYALGVTLFEALAGIKPFRAEGSYALMMKHVEAEPLPLEPLVPDGDPWPAVAALVRALLAKAPADRPASAGEVRDRLRALAAQLPRAVVTPSEATLTPAPDDDSWSLDDASGWSAAEASGGAVGESSSGAIGEPSSGAIGEPSRPAPLSGDPIVAPVDAIPASVDAISAPLGAIRPLVDAIVEPSRASDVIRSEPAAVDAMPGGQASPATDATGGARLWIAAALVALAGGAVGWFALGPEAPTAAAPDAGARPMPAGSEAAKSPVAPVDAGPIDAGTVVEPENNRPVAAEPPAAAPEDAPRDAEVRRGRITL